MLTTLSVSPQFIGMWYLFISFFYYYQFNHAIFCFLKYTFSRSCLIEKNDQASIDNYEIYMNYHFPRNQAMTACWSRPTGTIILILLVSLGYLLGHEYKPCDDVLLCCVSCWACTELLLAISWLPLFCWLCYLIDNCLCI